MIAGRAFRATAVLLASLTAVFGVATAGQAAAQTVSDDPADAAVSWLAGRFVDGNHLATEAGGAVYPDHGLTADAVLAFDGADAAQDVAAAATEWLAQPDNVAAYVGNGSTDSYVGSLAKLALTAIAQGEDPRAFGGVDLVTRLQQRQDDAGRYRDLSSFPAPPEPPADYSSGITQSLAIISLARAGEDTAAGVEYLLASRCPDGGFPQLFEQPTCTSQADTTGFAVQALLAVDRADEADAALDYLEGAQLPSGGFEDSGNPGAPNSNSTALAAQALRVGDRADAADAARDYLLGLQIGCDGPADQRGAIRFDEAGSGEVQRATAQAVGGLTGVGLADVDSEGAAAETPTVNCDAPATTSGAADSPAAADTDADSAGVGMIVGVGVVLLVLVVAVFVLLARRRRAIAAGGSSAAAAGGSSPAPVDGDDAR